MWCKQVVNYNSYVCTTTQTFLFNLFQCQFVFPLISGHIIIGTPGRLEDLMTRKQEGLDLAAHVRSLVCIKLKVLMLS